jgi:hypothetical protein
MRVYVFVKSDEARKLCRPFRRTKQLQSMQIDSIDEMRTTLNEANPGNLVYIDISGMDERRAMRRITTLVRRRDFHYGVLDPQGVIGDPASVFHAGAVDYVGAGSRPKTLELGRLKNVLGYLDRVREPITTNDGDGGRKRDVAPGYIVSGSDWSTVSIGQEYTFFFLYVAFDHPHALENALGRQNLAETVASFRDYLEVSLASCGGRLWMWSGYEGIVLFPFDGTESESIRCAFRMFLSKHLYDIEYSPFPQFLSFRSVIHVGNTVYHTQETGNVISDTLNSVFHIGQKFAKPGNLYVSAVALQYAYDPLKPYFVADGEFEGLKMYRMRRPIHRPE